MFDILTNDFDGEHSGGHYHNHELPDNAVDYFKFCTVRNPYDRVASAWSLIQNPNAIHRNQIFDIFNEHPDLITFLEWLIANREAMLSYALDGLKVGASLVPIHLYFEQRLHDMKMDAIIQIEHATKQFNELPFVHDYYEIPQIFSFRHYPWYTTWDNIKTPEVTMMVNAWAGDDFKKFNYPMQ